MALQASIKLNGLSIPKAYIRVESIFGGKTTGWNSLVSIYANAACAADGKTQPIEKFNQEASYDTSNLNALALIYTELSKLPRFSGCTLV